MASSGTGHIVQSLLVNVAIAIAKGVAAWLTGSGALLAEAIHSAADCSNQVLLLIGVHQARKPPTHEHPLGKGREVYFWSFLVALLLFSMGGVFSIYEGAHKFMNPEPVERLDRLFAERPTEFLPALMVSAETDPEERVRSFSTRVLGKLRKPESVELLRRLLNDRSVYVRFNAAWALGELTDRQARATLLRLEQRDPSPLVRQSAGESRRKIEGG